MVTPWVGGNACRVPCLRMLGNCAQTYCCAIKGIAQLVKKESWVILLHSEGVSVAICLNSGSNLDSEMQTLQRYHASFVAADTPAVIGDTVSKGLAGGLLLGKIINTLMAARQKIVTAEVVGNGG